MNKNDISLKFEHIKSDLMSDSYYFTPIELDSICDKVENLKAQIMKLYDMKVKF